MTYRGGEQVTVVEAETPIVSLESGAQSDLKPGAEIVAAGLRLADGFQGGTFILVAKDGLVPPMQFCASRLGYAGIHLLRSTRPC